MGRKGSGKDKQQKKPKKATSRDHAAKGIQGGSAYADRLRIWVQEVGPLIMLLIVSGLLLIGPFERGLFFPRELLAAKAVIFSLLIFWGCFRLATRDGRLIESPLDICLLILLFAYLVSFFFAVHKRDALDELLKIASYIIIYLAAIEICRYWRWPFKKIPFTNKQLKDQSDLEKPADALMSLPGLKILLHICLGAAFIVTIASLGAAAGYWEFAGAYTSYRIGSPMGYANTAAAYIMAAYLLALALAPMVEKWFKVLYLIPAVLMLVTIILTFSRGAWLLLPPLAILLIIVSSPGQRVRAFLYLAVTAVVAVPAAFVADPAFRAGAPAPAWIAMFLAIAAVIILGFGVELYLSRSKKVRLALAGGVVIAAIVVLIITVIVPATGPIEFEKALDEEQATQRVEQIIDNVAPNKDYLISLEVKAKQDPSADSNQNSDAWGISVLEGMEGYRDVEIVNHHGGETDGWETKELSFKTSAEALRLTVQVYNRHPGTSAAFRNVSLISDEQETQLSFAFNRILPDRFYDRLFSYSLDRNLDRRLDFYVDAVKIIRDYPLFGAGGGGWNALYRSYQEFPYDSTEVHNHFLQVWIEAGFFGFLAFTGIWISFTAAFIKNCVKKKAVSRTWQYWTASFIPVAALGAHSIIDWNFSLAAVGIFLFALLGAGRSLDQASWFGNPEKNTVLFNRRGLFIGIFGLIAGIFLLAYNFALIHGLYATWRSQEYMQQRNYKQAIIEMQSAMRTDPYRSDNYHNLNVLLEDRIQRTQSPADVEAMLDLSREAYELEPFNPNYVSRYGNLMLQYVDVEEGLKYLDSMIELRPFVDSSYLQPAISRLQIAEFLLQEGEQTQAERFLNEVIAIEPVMKEYYGEIEPLAFVLGRAHYLLGDVEKAVQYYEKVDEEDFYYDQALEELAEIAISN